MHNRIAELIERLTLQPHPEGGYYHEIYRSAAEVNPGDERDMRSALTTIFFLLHASQHSCWHRVRSDEVWHFYEGDPLELIQLDPNSETVHTDLIGPIDETGKPVAIVPADCWQAARTTGEYTLVGCTVGPGFAFEDFQLLRDIEKEADFIRNRFPELSEYL